MSNIIKNKQRKLFISKQQQQQYSNNDSDC